MNKFLIASMLLVLIIFSLGYYFNQKEIESQRFGYVYGKISLTSGNCMPGIAGGGVSSCLVQPVSRQIYIMEPSYDKIEAGYLKESLFSNRIIKTIVSNEDGTYKIELPVGNYSLFVNDADKKFCNSFSGKGNCIIEIKEGQGTQFNPDINIYAAY